MAIGLVAGIAVVLAGCNTASLSRKAVRVAATVAQNVEDTVTSGDDIEIRAAMRRCIDNYRTPDAIRPAFVDAGYEYQPEDFGGGEVIHRYVSADRQVVALVDPEERFCAISSNNRDVTQGLETSLSVLEEVFAGQVNAGSPENKNIRPGDPQAGSFECSGHHVFAPRSLIWVTVGNAGQDPVCIDDGTSQIMINM